MPMTSPEPAARPVPHSRNGQRPRPEPTRADTEGPSAAHPRRSPEPTVGVAVVAERVSGQHSVALVTMATAWTGSVTTVTHVVPTELGQTFLTAARTGSANAPAPIGEDRLPDDELLRCIATVPPPILPGGDGLDDPSVAAAVFVLVQTGDGRWFGSPIGDPPIISHGGPNVLSRANALRWTAAPTGTQHALDELMDSALATVSDL